MDRWCEDDIPAKKSKRLCKYLEKWDGEFTFLKSSRMGRSHAFYKICNCDFTVSHGEGMRNVSQHEKSAKHKKRLKAQKHVQPMSSFVTRNTTEANQVLNAKVEMAMLCAKNIVSFNFCDDYKCVAQMFPDSTTAQKYSAEKTKTMQSSKLLLGLGCSPPLTSILKVQEGGYSRSALPHSTLGA
ncbi:hypothetical protein JRQ81_016399 [Phrynocephalus forsythii]|uniref:Uncharacterized protein n=1 Tax=Phrynocephalus forsythii TaxID=171643 RepID=A0A9Q0XUP0_9SAUR|nr:hypothetical protein JRQ81_016399 [Phrynocephalus forsythii]